MKMPEDSYRAPPRKTVGYIRHVAEQLAAVLELSERPLFPVMQAIERELDQEFNLLRFEVWSPEEMGINEGLSFIDGDVSRIVLAEHIYAGACKGQWRARRIAAHELGHWALHSKLWAWEPALISLAPNTANDTFVEDEAEIFSIELLMPLRHIRLTDTVLDVAQRFQAPRVMAENRLRAAHRVRARQKRTADQRSAALEKLVTG
jgi:hypothetical protein